MVCFVCVFLVRTLVYLNGDVMSGDYVLCRRNQRHGLVGTQWDLRIHFDMSN
ncbi:hypothetical protein GLYMA_06G115951v4 [Glycine max]|nr:hypothetical protein GLYMA_06G115951v4 [Glycine max]KAH1125390.1 hypothetical protein GYH30_014806 [Glycine max]